jgi:hypothetical protein
MYNNRTIVLDVPTTLEEFDEALLQAVHYMDSEQIFIYWEKWLEYERSDPACDWATFLNWVIDKER